MNHPLFLVPARTTSIIYCRPKGEQYLYSTSESISDLSSHKGNIYIPLTVDTEFFDRIRMGITVQMRGIHEDNGLIYDHLDLQHHATVNNLQLRHLPIRHDFAPLDHLEARGHEVELKIFKQIHKQDLYGNKLPFCQFDIFAHFALAEWGMIFTGEAKARMVDLTLNGKSRIVEMTRRFRTLTKTAKGIQRSDAIELPFHLILDGKTYRIKIRVIDSCALHGVASYKNLAKATGVELKYKETLDQEDLENMLDTYFNKPEEFDNYALGDLEVYKILENNGELFKKVYGSLGIEKYSKLPKLTIGSTVRDLFHSKLCHRLGIELDDEKRLDKLSEYLAYGSSSTLKLETTTNLCLHAKVFGGRCRNNRPTDIGIENNYPDFLVRTEVQEEVKKALKQQNTLGKLTRIIVDNDIAGAYGNGLRNQIYPVGRPVFEKFEVCKRKNANQYLTLREWLKKRKYGKDNCELVPGLWTAIVSTKEDYRLKYPQDFLISWFDFKYADLASMDTDTDKVDLEIQPKTGTTKIFNHQVINAQINSDYVEWVYNICSPRQRNELLDNIYVQTACYYPSYSQIDSFDELSERFDNWELQNTTQSKKVKVDLNGKAVFNGSVHMVNNEPTAWIGLDLGELIVDDLLAWRKMHQQQDGKKSPMDVLFKLCTNTLYGVFCSPYFDISNTVVGNNITARCRAMAWYMEKGHYAFQTITDGGQVDLETICFPASEKRKVTALSVTNLYRLEDTTKNHLRLKLLGEYDSVAIDYSRQEQKIAELEAKNKPYTFADTIDLKVVKDGDITIIDNPKQWLQVTLFAHLQYIFPNVSVLHQETTKLIVSVGEDKTPIKSYEPLKGMFTFEIKDIYTKARFHGTSNYLLANDMTSHVKMRSYEKKKHQAFTINESEEIIETNFYETDNPSKFFLEQLDNPQSVRRSKVFKKTGILKLNDWRNNSDKWLDKGYFCGDTIEKTGLLREFSISQFTYHTKEQYQAIEKEVQRNKRRYNQSYEGYFLNEDRTLNYQLMIETIDKIIASGAHSINDVLDKDDHRSRDLSINHPQAKVYQLVKQQANNESNVDTDPPQSSLDLDNTFVFEDGDIYDDEF